MSTLFLTQQGSKIKRDGERIIVSSGETKLVDMPIRHIDRIGVFGNANFTTPALNLLFQRNIDVLFLTHDGRFKGRIQTENLNDSVVRQQQYRKASDTTSTAYISGQIVSAKIKNQIAFLRRHHIKDDDLKQLLNAEEQLRAIENEESDPDVIRGFEGIASRNYFQCFRKILREDYRFQKRTKRPPTDPVNVLLSLGYTMLYNRVHGMLLLAGLDPYCGLFHDARYGHAALASDMMEEFRTPIVDVLVIRLFNKRVFGKGDLNYRGKAAALKKDSLKKFLTHFEGQMDFQVQVKQSREKSDDLVTDKDNGSFRLDYAKVIYRQVIKLRDYVVGKSEVYTPYRMTR